MSNIIHLNALSGLRGRCTVTARKVCPRTGKTICGCGKCDPYTLGWTIYKKTHENNLFSIWKSKLVEAMASGNLSVGIPAVMAFSKTVVDQDPQPTEFDNEFRAAISIFNSANVLQLLAVLPSSAGNSPAGNIRTIGFYFGADATLTPGTGTLGSIINNINVPKDSSTEVSFQYDITFG